MGVTAVGRQDEAAWVREPWAGLAMLLVVGTCWHFAYDWLGRWWPVGLVAPVNESVWEHAKLVAIPMLLWAALVGWWTEWMPGSLLAGVVGGIAGSMLMVIGYYSYVAVLRDGTLPMDIVLFVLCSLVALVVFGRLRGRSAGPGWPALPWQQS